MRVRAFIQTIKKPEFFFWLFLILILSPWICFTFRIAPNPDMLWLTTILDRVLHGGSMSQNGYETNPPSSVVSVFPFYLLAKTGFSLAASITIVTLAALCLSVIASAKIIRSWPGTDRLITKSVIAGFLFAETIMTLGIYAGERDHLIALALFPFTLAQWALTMNWPLPRRLSRLVFALGAPIILIKPHFALLPTLLILHRAWHQRSLRVLRDPDFISLACATLLIAAFFKLFFPDWFQFVLPDVLHLYLPVRAPTILRQALLWCLAPALLALCTGLTKIDPPRRTLIFFFCFDALINFIPYYVQGRGFFYHMLPAFGFLGAALGPFMYEILRRECRPLYALLFSTILLAGTAYLAFPLDWSFPSARTYQKFPLTQTIATCDGRGQPCPFFMFNNVMGILHETSYYTGAPLASRFGSYWFLPLLVEGDKLTPSEKETYRQKFSRLVGEDFAHYQPQLLIIGRFPLDGKIFDFGQYFSTDPVFASEWKKYTKTGSLKVDRSAYYGKGFNPEKNGIPTITFDLYHRRP